MFPSHDLEGWEPPAHAPVTAAKIAAYMEDATPIQVLAEMIRGNENNIVKVWRETSRVACEEMLTSPDPKVVRAAEESLELLKYIPVRPFYCASELGAIFPDLLHQYLSDKRLQNTAPGQIMRELRACNFRILENADDPAGFLWGGAVQNFLILFDEDDWGGKPITQDQFNSLMTMYAEDDHSVGTRLARRE